MAVEQTLEQCGAAALMAADEPGALQPLERRYAFGTARDHWPERAGLEDHGGGIFRDACKELRPRRRASGARQQLRDRSLVTGPIAGCRHVGSL